MDKLERILQAAEYDLVIVDEINYCLHRGLIYVERAPSQLVERRPENVELVFTGRYAARGVDRPSGCGHRNAEDQASLRSRRASAERN